MSGLLPFAAWTEAVFRIKNIIAILFKTISNTPIYVGIDVGTSDEQHGQKEVREERGEVDDLAGPPHAFPDAEVA